MRVQSKRNRARLPLRRLILPVVNENPKVPAEPTTKEGVAQLEESLVAEMIVTRDKLQDLLNAQQESRKSKGV